MTFKECLSVLLKLAKEEYRAKWIGLEKDLENVAEMVKAINTIEHLLSQENIELDLSYSLDYLMDDAMKIAASFDGKPVSELYRIPHPRRDKITVEFERIAEDTYIIPDTLIEELKEFNRKYEIKLCSIGVKEEGSK